MTRARSAFVALAAIAGGVAAGWSSCRSSIALAMGVITGCGLVLFSTGSGAAPKELMTRANWRAARQSALPVTVFGAGGSAVALLAWLLLGPGHCVS